MNKLSRLTLGLLVPLIILGAPLVTSAAANGPGGQCSYNSSTGTCMAQCSNGDIGLMSSDCDINQALLCCPSAPGGGGDVGASCSGDNFSITNGFCAESNNCSPNSTDSSSSCRSGLICCSPTPLVQGGGAGAKAVGDTCSTGSDCASGSCKYDSEVKTYVCAAALKSIGEACTDASECSSDYCILDPEIKSRVCASPTSQTGGGCIPGDQCVTGNQVYGFCDANGVCQPNSGTDGSGVPVGSGGAGGTGGTSGGAGGKSGSGGAINLTYLSGYKDSIITIINDYLVPMLMALAFIIFIWGVYKYFILGAAEEGEKSEGRKFAMWGVIGFVIILSVWGIVNIVKDTLNLGQGGNNVPTYPKL